MLEVDGKETKVATVSLQETDVLHQETERAKPVIFVVLRNSKTDTPAGQNLIFVEGQFAEDYGIYSGRAFSSAFASLCRFPDFDVLMLLSTALLLS